MEMLERNVAVFAGSWQISSELPTPRITPKRAALWIVARDILLGHDAGDGSDKETNPGSLKARGTAQDGPKGGGGHGPETQGCRLQSSVPAKWNDDDERNDGQWNGIKRKSIVFSHANGHGRNESHGGESCNKRNDVDSAPETTGELGLVSVSSSPVQSIYSIYRRQLPRSV